MHSPNKMKMMASLKSALVALVLAAMVLPSSDVAASSPFYTASPVKTSQVVERHVTHQPLLQGRAQSATTLLADASRAMSPKHRTRISRTDANTSRLSRPKTRIGRFMRRLTHRPKTVSADKAASLIKAGDKVFVPVGQVTSNTILKALAAHVKVPKSGYSTKKPVEIVGLSNTASRSVFDRQGKVIPRALFLGANARGPVAAGRGDFVPVYFGRIPRMIREGKVPVDVAVLQVSKPDKLGYVTLGPTAGCTLAAMEKAKTVVAQVNDQVPRTKGSTRIHISQLDYVVKANEPLAPIPAAKISDTDKKIAQHVVKLVLKDKAGAGPKGIFKRTVNKLFHRNKVPTFQFGIGGIPDAVANQLASSKQLKACKVRSELIGPGTRKLVDAGKVKGKVMYTFAMGDHGFLKWMNNNNKLLARPVDIVNDPHKIGKTNNMVAINSAVKVDLNGQVNAQYIKDQWYSGVGGQVDFMRGAMNSKGGKAIIALPSTAMVSDSKGGKKLISKIVPRLGESDVVTTNMHDLQYVVTEHGVASMEGKGAVERARSLIKIAHPQFRQELTKSLDTQLLQRRQAEQRQWDKYQASKQ